MTHRGHMQNGVIVLDPPAAIPDGAQVEITVVNPPTDADADEIPSLYDRLKSAVGKAQGLPEDAAHNHDHYLYGLPKKSPPSAADGRKMNRVDLTTPLT